MAMRAAEDTGEAADSRCAGRPSGEFTTLAVENSPLGKNHAVRLPPALALLAACCALASCGDAGGDATHAHPFDAARAFADLRAEVALGPRPAGSAANRRDAGSIARRLRAAGVGDVRIQRPWLNVVGRIPGSEPGSVVVG